MYCMRSRLLPLLVVAAVGLALVPSAAAGAATTRVGRMREVRRAGSDHPAPHGRRQRPRVPAVDPRRRTTRRSAHRLLFNFHGLGSNMQQQALYSGLNQKAGAEGYVVITPNGTGTALRRWSFPPLPGSAADVDFVKAMLATTQRTLCIDPKRVFSTGISNGAIFSTVLACALPGRLAAIAPVAGVNATDVCSAGTPPTAVLAFHGTADPIVPYNGGAYFSGVNARRTGRIQAEPVDDAVANWARFDGCGTPATTTAVADDVEHVTYPDCPPSGTVELYRVVGGGHTWPGAIPDRAPRVRRLRRSTPAR